MDRPNPNPYASDTKQSHHYDSQFLLPRVLPAQIQEEEEQTAAAMGCSSSKLDEEAAVKTCHDRKSFVKKAIAQRGSLASSHVAYVQSLRRVSMALFYYFAEDEHLYFLQEQSSSLCLHHPSLPEKKVLVINCLRPAGAPVHPVLEHWDPEAVETATIDRFFGVDHQFFRSSPIDHPMNDTPISPQPARWDLSWDPFSSTVDHHLYADYGVEGIKVGQEDEQIPELEEESDDDSDGHDHPEGETEEEEEEEEEEAGEGEEQADAAAPEVAPPPRVEEEEREMDHVNNELRVLASADVEQHGTPGFTVYVHRPPASMAEAMKDIQGHFMKIVDTASEVSELPEVVPYRRRVQPPAPVEDGEEQGAPEVPPEPFELFQSHKESLDRLYEWEKRLYEEVRGERVRLAYEKKCALLRSQDANGAEPFAIEKTRIAIRDPRTKLDISLTSVDAVSKRIVAVRDNELLPQLMQLVRGLARMWRVIADAHRVMKRTADDACALLTSSAAAAAAARPALVSEGGGIRGPPPPPSSTRAAAGASALGAELRGWRAALEAWAESQRAYAAALWGWARSCAKDGEDMPRLVVGWARAVESVDVDAATRAVDAVATEAAAIATAVKRQQRGGEEWFNEEEAKKKVCLGLTAALAAVADAGGLAVAAYDELLLEMEMGAREPEGEITGMDQESIQN